MAERWHIDKAVPLALIVTIAGGAASLSATGIVYMTKLETRVANVEEKIEPVTTLNSDVAVLKEQVRSFERLVNRVENILDRRAGAEREDRKRTIRQ